MPRRAAPDRGDLVWISLSSDHVKSLDWRARRAEFVCRLPRRTTLEVLHKLATLVSPPAEP